ncbi:adenylosuccinate lyase [Desulfosporosinus metallidurans]|uniref:Adenylosuccinate lyase n=1 Tax=Desulfosporosinus metallidurans TaxID=1888891 RepID=A0A1Q8R343_9FIRM|nr:adenylosuccinate lyase [Desulfosporosinus metallidurans]OLN33989.1 Adenylosuccinate lyase [Desulfosporosinus metallidurans]
MLLDRYTHPEMGKLWQDGYEYERWLEVELAVAEVMTKRGEIPQEAMSEIRRSAKVNPKRVLEIEHVVRHDLIAFLQAVVEEIGEAGKYLHLGLTSSDVKDTALSLVLRDSGRLLKKDLQDLRSALVNRALESKYTVMVGRSHGIHAEPLTFGLKLALWIAELDRQMERLDQAIVSVSVGKISGAVGTYANVSPEVEEAVCTHLGLEAALVSNQILQRDRHAHYITTLALIGGSLEKIATEIRNLQRTEILEVEEPFAEGQKGSSAMPHKRNPIVCEQVSGMSRLLRGNALAAMENITLWHERDMSHSSVERVILPDSCLLLDHMLRQMTRVISGLKIREDQMRRNLQKTFGLTSSQRVLLALVEHGCMREEAYAWVQQDAFAAWDNGQDFIDVVSADDRVANYLSKEEIAGLFDLKYHLQHVDDIFKRLRLES